MIAGPIDEIAPPSSSSAHHNLPTGSSSHITITPDDEFSSALAAAPSLPADIPIQITREAAEAIHAAPVVSFDPRPPATQLRFQASLSTSAHAPSPTSSATTNKDLAAAMMNNNSNNNKRLYRASGHDSTTTATTKYVTRDIAALDFLLGIPLAAEAHLVQTGWRLQQKQQEEDDYLDVVGGMMNLDSSHTEFSLAGGVVPIDANDREAHYHAHHHAGHHPSLSSTISHGTWWEKYIRFPHSTSSPLLPSYHSAAAKKSKQAEEAAELERPDAVQLQPSAHNNESSYYTRSASGALLPAYTPGRRLDGDPAIRIQIPLTTPDDTKTGQKSIARTAALREWERQTAHGLHASSHPPLLDGRLFFAASVSYPISVFSVIRYEPRREQAEFRRKKLESLGGGGSQFVMPTRDWRGISYRALLPRRHHQQQEAKRRRKWRRGRNTDETTFNRFMRSGSSGHENDKLQPKDKSTATAVSGGGDTKHNHDHNTANKNKNGNDDDDDDTLSSSSGSSEDSNVYVPGLLDDPDMVLGRHHTVMMGDHITGPLVASTIQFVKPALLKAELNKQFRERFDGWEPPKSSRKYIGAYVSVQEGKYVLTDPTSAAGDTGNNNNNGDVLFNQYDDGRGGFITTTRPRQGSVTSMSSAGETTITGGPKEKPILRIPPSLTLSKIRSLKQQALAAAIKAKLEVSTVALACVYFERLCLDCRVDKSNRRLSFAACLLLASKINEPNSRLVMKLEPAGIGNETAQGGNSVTRSLVRPNKRSKKIFAFLLEFFTEQWSLSVKNLFNAEWGVFCALGFKLDASPSQVAFHFKRLMKTLEWNPRHYLGSMMWEQWQDALQEEERRKRERERRREIQRKRKEERLLDLQLKLENEVMRRHVGEKHHDDDSDGNDDHVPKTIIREKAVRLDQPHPEPKSAKQQEHSSSKKTGGKGAGGLLNRLGMRRIQSVERIESLSEHAAATRNVGAGDLLPYSPSMPTLYRPLGMLEANGGAGIHAIDIPAQDEQESDAASSLGLMDDEDKMRLMV